MKYTKWCPKGCGKSIIVIKSGNQLTPPIYECTRCKYRTTNKEDLK